MRTIKVDEALNPSALNPSFTQLLALLRCLSLSVEWIGRRIMDGANFGNPIHGGFAAFSHGGGGSGGGRRGGSGGAIYSVAAGNGFCTTADTLEVSTRMHQLHEQGNIENSNPFMQLFYQQQMTQHSAVDWPHGGGANVSNASFIPISASGGGAYSYLYPYHSNNSYPNNAGMMNNSYQGSFVPSANIATSRPPMHPYVHGSVISSATMLPSVPNSHAQYSHSSSPLVRTDPKKFYLKDELKGFFAVGQRHGLSPFCNGVDKHRKAMDREIKRHDILLRIWRRHDSEKGFIRGDSKIALEYIDKLDLPCRPQREPKPSIPPSARESLTTPAKSTVNMRVHHFISLEERQIVGHKDDLLVDKDFVTAMRMLKAADVCCVPCTNGLTAISCQSPSCDERMVVRSRVDNRTYCTSCVKKKLHAPIAATRNEQNRAERTAPGSKTPYNKLSLEERNERYQRTRNEKKRHSTRIQKLADKLAMQIDMVNNEEVRDKDVTPSHEDEHSSKSEEFLSNVKEMLNDLLRKKDRHELKDTLHKILSTAMETMIENEKSKKPDAKVDMDDVTAMVDCIVENMENMSKSVSGKGRQCRFSPTTLALATAVYNASPSAYREMKANSTLNLPCERHMRRVKAETTVKDGQTTKPYLTVKAMMKARNIEKFEGLLQCDEMKLLHGMTWNTQTGDAVGLADDMLDINSLIRRIFSEEGHTVEAAVYVNQWQYVAITDEGVEYFLVEHFYNDGSLTGETLLNQFEHVLKMCEEVNMKVSGLCFDAGGNNARLFCMLRLQKRLKGEAWLNDEDCSIPHTIDPSRKLYVWFCTTHVLKALRNQFRSSNQSGKKAFQDESGTNFGWAFVEKLFDKLQARNSEYVTNGVRLNAKAVSPNKGDKMNVSLAKIPFEWKTNAFALTVLAEELNISAAELKTATEEARLAYPNKRSESEGKAWSDLKHGHALEQARYLQRVYTERCKGTSDDEVAGKEAVADSHVEVEVEHDMDDDIDELDDDDFDEEDDEHAYAELESDESDAKAKSIRSTNDDAPQDSIASDLASLLFMVHIQSLFHDLFMSKHEKITQENCGIVEKLVKGYLSYFEDWKRAQMKRKRANVDGWERTFLAHQTWKNMRHALCGFVHFSKYMVEKRGVKYVPMLLSNSSSLESRFSRQRRTNHDSASKYSSGVSNMTTKSARAQTTGRCYLTEDCVEEKGTGRNNLPNGFSLAKKQRLQTEAARQQITARRKSINEQRRTETTSLFATEEPPTKQPEMQELAQKLNHQIDTSVVDAIIETKRFQQFNDLCHDETSTKEWIDKFVTSPHEDLEPLFHKITSNLLSYFEDEIYGSNSTPCFGISVREYLVSAPFHNDVVHRHLNFDGIVSRKGSIMVIDAIVELFLARVYSIVSDMKVVDDVIVTEETPDFYKMLQNIVGAGISKASERFCPLENGNGPEYDLLGAMGVLDKDPLIDDDYRSKYYTQQYQIENQGKLNLIHPNFIPWSIKLLLFTIKRFTKSRMIRYRRDTIKVGKKELLADKRLFNEFLKAAGNAIDLDDIDRCTLRKIYVRVATFTFHAYTGEKWDREFNRVKHSADDTSTIHFRHLLKARGSVKGSTNVQKKSAQPTKKPLSTLLGVEQKKNKTVSKKRKQSGDDASGSKRSRTTDDAMKVTYKQLFLTNVIPKLKELNFDINRICSSKTLNMEERCAFAFVHFDKFHKWKNKDKISSDGIKQVLKTEMEKENEWHTRLLSENTSNNS